MKKFLAGLLTAVFCCGLLSGCGPSDFQLAMYDAEDKVLMAADSYYYKKHIKQVTDTRYEADFTDFTGADTIWDSNNDPVDGEFTIEGSVQVTEGGFRLVLVSSTDAEVFFDSADGKDDFSITKDLSSGRWRVKMLAKEASGSIDILLPGTPS